MYLETLPLEKEITRSPPPYRIHTGVYATNKARGRRRRAAQRQEERRSRLRSVFAISGASDRGNNGATESDGDGVDNPNYEGEPTPDLVSPPPYALVVEAELLEQERRRQVCRQISDGYMHTSFICMCRIGQNCLNVSYL